MRLLFTAIILSALVMLTAAPQSAEARHGAYNADQITPHQKRVGQRMLKRAQHVQQRLDAGKMSEQRAKRIALRMFKRAKRKGLVDPNMTVQDAVASINR